MSRIYIEYTGNTVFSTTATVRITDLSGASHLGFDCLVNLLNDAAAQFFGEVEKDHRIDRIGRIYADLAVSYRSEAFFQDMLQFDIAIGQMRSKSLELLFRVTRVESNQVVALARIGVLYFDYSCRKVVALPPFILDALRPACHQKPDSSS